MSFSPLRYTGHAICQKGVRARSAKRSRSLLKRRSDGGRRGSREGLGVVTASLSVLAPVQRHTIQSGGYNSMSICASTRRTRHTIAHQLRSAGRNSCCRPLLGNAGEEIGTPAACSAPTLPTPILLRMANTTMECTKSCTFEKHASSPQPVEWMVVAKLAILYCEVGDKRDDVSSSALTKNNGRSRA